MKTLKTLIGNHMRFSPVNGERCAYTVYGRITHPQIDQIRRIYGDVRSNHEVIVVFKPDGRRLVLPVNTPLTANH
jgi:hypothetical protein